MYKIYADDTLIYDSELEDYRINKGSISLEINKSGSFSFSIYPEHFYYDKFIKMKTIIKVTRSDEIIFRGRILNDITDYFNNKVITCEGELGFLNDSIIRPFSFQGLPENLFKKFIEEHNSQVDDFKKFKIGACTVIDPNNYIIRENSAYETALSNMSSRLTNGSLGGYFVITHENNEDTPTINYLADYSMKDSQVVEFGSNLKNYTKTVKAENMTTAIIPLGATIDDESEKRLTIESVNEGKDYICDEQAVKDYGFIFKTVEWDDITQAENLLKKAKEYLSNVINQDVTIELTAIDLHLLNKNIKAFSLGDYIKVISAPHKVNTTMMCSKQTVDLLNPDNDSIILGATLSTLSGNNASSEASFIDKQKKNYINLLNRLSSKSGFYSSYEEDSTGGRIQYIHDKPERSASSIIWKMTAEAVQVSTDGGLSYTAGISCDGDALYQTIIAKGINADDIKTGTLTVGGPGTDSTQLKILNKYNDVCVTADENGIVIFNGEIHATSGTLENMTIVNGIDVSKEVNGIRRIYSCLKVVEFDTSYGPQYYLNLGSSGDNGERAFPVMINMLWVNGSASFDSYTSFREEATMYKSLSVSGKISVSGGIESPKTSTFGQLYVNGWLHLGYYDYFADNGYAGICISEDGTVYKNTSNRRINRLYCSNAVSTSDRKLKKDIKPLNCEKAKEFIMNLNPCSFLYKDNEHGRKHLGFIAQEIAEISPSIFGDLSLYEADVVNDDGSTSYYDPNIEDEKLAWGLKYSELIAPLTAFVQMQQKKIETLEEKMKILEGKLKNENN